MRAYHAFPVISGIFWYGVPKSKAWTALAPEARGSTGTIAYPVNFAIADGPVAAGAARSDL
jgi:hypothetical protein